MVLHNFKVFKYYDVDFWLGFLQLSPTRQQFNLLITPCKVKRNIQRFPDDFMFQLTKNELLDLRCQFGTSSWGGSRYLPYVFTEQGIAMLSGLLNSDIAVKVNIQIMRTFVQLRHYVLGQNTNEQIAELRKLLMLYIEKNDKRVNDIIIALNNLISQPVQTKKIGFS